MNLWQKFKESEIFKNWFKTNQQNHDKNQESNRISFFNSKNQLEKYGAERQKISLAKNCPEFIFPDDQNEISKLWTKFLFFNQFVSLYQNIEQNLYVEGNYAIGLDYINQEKFNKTPLIRIAKILEKPRYKCYEMRKIKLLIDEIELQQTKYQIIEEYDLELDKEKSKITTYAINQYGKQIPLKKLNYEPRNNIYDFIPWVIFKNRSDEKGDFEALVNDENFEALNIDFEMLIHDVFYSAPWHFIKSENEEQKKEIQKAIWNIAQRIIVLSDVNDFFDTLPIGQLQANSQAKIILDKITEQIEKIKEWAFLKKNTANIGTKNIQGLEMVDLNSDFHDYIETKANLRELNLFSFLVLWQKVLNHHQQKIDFEPENVQIIVTNSTKWKQREKAKNLQINNQHFPNKKIINEQNELGAPNV